MSRLSFRTVLILLVTGVAGLACQVPVFRYALERWDADIYKVIVWTNGPLSESSEQALWPLREAMKRDTTLGLTRVDLQVVDRSQPLAELRKSLDRRSLRLLQQAKFETTTPVLTAFYPAGNELGIESPAYRETLSKQAVVGLIDSPVRQEITERLTKGHSAVWIFVPIGDPEKDNPAYERLQKQIALDADWLELPSAEELELGPETLSGAKIPLQIKFSIITLERTDKREKFLVDSLLNSESDLTSFDEPLAFPVLGRGRVLYGLVGKGIAADTIRTASSFIVGPCSCQVKNQNPGFDLLLLRDWDKAVGETLISQPIDRPDRDGLAPTLLTIPPGRSK